MHPTCPRTQVYSIYTIYNPNFKQIENRVGRGVQREREKQGGPFVLGEEEKKIVFSGISRSPERVSLGGKVKEFGCLFVSLRLDQLGVAHVPKGTANLVD